MYYYHICIHTQHRCVPATPFKRIGVTHLAVAVTGIVEVYVFAICRPHGQRIFQNVPFVILFKLQFRHTVKQLRQMISDLQYGKRRSC